MPTYADLYNEKLRASGQSGPSNPVRLTISKGDYVFDAETGRFQYEERWEEEHLMEDENYLDAPSPKGNSGSREPSPPPMAALQPTLLFGQADNLTHRPSLWVLDTNTLVSCLDLLKALFAALLTRNVAYAAAVKRPTQHSAEPTLPSPIKLVIPYVVVWELDGLKITSRKNDSGRPVASQAREANHWLFSALQKQKRVPIDQAGAHLADTLWPLYAQPSAHYNGSKRKNGANSRFTFQDSLSCDDEIIKFCVDLKHKTPSSVCFCSDDINARTKAEMDNIDSLGMRELARALKTNVGAAQSTESKWMLVADALIEQWDYQNGSVQQHDQQQQQQQQNLQQRFDPHLAQQPTWPLALAPHASQSLGATTCTHPIAPPPALIPAAHIATNSEILDMDMDTEENQPPSRAVQSTPTPITLTPARSAPSLKRLSSEGRSTNDSIHSPQKVQRSSKTKPRRSSVYNSVSSATPFASTAATAEQEHTNGEALNPQLDWEDLMQQFGRPNKKSRNTRW
ncbi:hypothetical protein NDA14_005328 [Ustilago hordei]|nr:hypothetical protein NDA14_005328 [Ustilago hordei]UTT92567.1 hypothetical protein NDA17_004333 [Ustilago hordei]